MYIALNASSKLTGVVGVGVTTVPVTAGTGTQFAVGSNHSYVTFQDATNKETCKITGQSGDNLTVVRTKALSWAIGTVIECRPCAEAMADYAVAPQIDGSAAKTTPVDADTVGLIDSAASSALKKVTWANIKATLKTYFDTLYAALSGATFTGGINEARGSVAMHATTMDLWAQPNIIDGTSTAVTITAIANAPQAGARRTLYPVAGSIITNGATFAVDGAADATAAAGDKWEFEAITTSTYKVHVTKKDGTAVASSSGSGQLLKYTKITATDAAWAKQAGTNRIVVCCKGGGGAGGGNNTAYSAAAEGGFAGCIVWGESSTLTATFVATIGAGGTGVSGASGNSGGTTSFTTSTPTTIASAPGGAGGQYSAIGRVYAGQLGTAGQTGEAVGGVGTNAAAGGAAAANSAAGGGGCSGASGSNLTGGAGGSGVIHVWEFS